MSRRLNVRPTALLVALPLTTMACATAPPPARIGPAAIVAAVVETTTGAETESEIPSSESESEPELPGSAIGADCEGVPELSCRLGNTKAPNYQPDDRS